MERFICLLLGKLNGITNIVYYVCIVIALCLTTFKEKQNKCLTGIYNRANI